MTNKSRLIETFCEIVRIDSPSGEEQEISDDLSKRFNKLGLNVIHDTHGNIIASDNGDPTLILSVHMDTVEPGRGINPIVSSDFIKTDGSTILGGDCKAGIAAIIECLQTLKENNISRPSIQIVVTRGEEIGLDGAKNLDFSLIKGNQVIVFDGGGSVSNITISTPTYTSFKISVTGRSAHAGVEPEKGLSAIKVLSGIIQELPQGRINENTTINIGIISGGSVVNAVPEFATCSGEFRSRNQSDIQDLHNILELSLKNTRDMYPDASIDCTTEIKFHSYDLDEESPVVARLINTLKSLDLQSNVGASGGGTDANIFNLNQRDAVVVGTGTHGMHTKREYVVIQEMIDASNVCQYLLVGEQSVL
jgi:tripeptide aminopeptidase